MVCEKVDKLGYKELKDLRFQIDLKQDYSFALCFWIYLPKSTPFPCTILHQLHSDNPFLALGKDKRVILSPSSSLHEESAVIPSVILETEFPLEQWVHLGCEVCCNVIRIHFDGKVMGEQSVSSSDCQNLMTVTLSARHEGFDSLDGYAYNSEVLRSTSIKNHYVKDPPLQLCIDSASASDIELESDGIWNIVGGKVSCRKKFSVDVLLLDAFGQPRHRDFKVVASLIYADDWSPVEKAEENAAPLLVIYDGLEFPSRDKPIKIFEGRASFKMYISQLSSKCENKLFRIKFDVPEIGNYPFFEAFTPPVRCISSTSNGGNMSTITWKKLPSGIHLFNGSSSPQYAVGHSELQSKAICETKPNPPSKRVKFGEDTPMENTKADTTAKQHEEECNSYTVPENEENYGSIDDSGSDSESAGAKTSELKNTPCNIELLSDLTIFRYCLGSFSERSAMLNEISVAFSEADIADMAEKVAFFSGCTHHRHQITIVKGLLEEGEKVWNLISRGSQKIHWDDVVFVIEEQFMRIACCSTRALTQQDFNFLRRSSGGRDYLTKDDFDRMWCWLYPVAYTISKHEINLLWASTSSKWIEGFITKEEVEYALQGPLGNSDPGTFILRFPTTRSWPHPDAGSLIASYVGSDFSLHHRQLSLDYSAGMFDSNPKPLEELLLSELELSRVIRILINAITHRTNKMQLTNIPSAQHSRFTNGCYDPQVVSCKNHVLRPEDLLL
ncbi:hypothetical protein KSS87_014148, partial [Heliosperma pusillum]